MDTTFSQRLREALAAKQMTQEALAREVGVTLKAVTNWASGESEPKGRALIALARILDRDPAWFFEPQEAAA